MNAQQILQADWLDLLFEGRNKAYGAYDLRRTYDSHLIKALFAMAGAVVLVMAGANMYGGPQRAGSIINAPDSVVFVNLEPPKDNPTPPPTQAKPPAAAAPAQTIPTFIVPDDQVPPPADDPAPPADDVLRPVGEPGTGVEGGTGTGSGGGGDAPAAPAAPPAEDPDKEFTIVSQQARFPGGSKAWIRYLESRLNANLPVDNGAPSGQYSVVVSFLVDREGQISDVQVVKPQPFGMSEEAVRVIARGPKWEPAQQNGRKVVFRQQQTITFQVAEE